ncbi:hypothetical protein [Paraburkholderia sp. SG-MS1]|uniref:hypothetical protein n=1 Tax=Paraburkholderia sp. SG-MS1 TaxID=2023741 RepID=UPI001EEB67F2|nr:hypothetical protein [Paraburkholderia sp. SG-MS1]
MSQLLLSLFNSVLSDGLSAEKFAAANTIATSASEILKNIIQHRQTLAARILLDELKSGARRLDESDLPEAAAILFRYQRAAEEGAAKLNLRLLAAVFAGQVVHRSVAADDFLYLADILAPLKRDEVILLGTIVRLHAQPNEQSKSMRDLQLQTIEELVPSVFDDAEDLMATAGALLRTGLLIANVPPANYGGQGSGFIYRPTRLLLRLNQLSNIEGVVERCTADDNTIHTDGMPT